MQHEAMDEEPRDLLGLFYALALEQRSVCEELAQLAAYDRLVLAELERIASGQ
jgi:hypothetical protein